MKDIVYELQDMRYLNWARTRKSSGTAGSFLKSYDDTGVIRKYYKLSDYVPGKGIVGHECINEVIVQRLLDMLSIDHLNYRLIHALVHVDGSDMETYLCESEDFKRNGESKMALEDFYAAEKQDGETPMDLCTRMGWEQRIYNMLILDQVILNRDRHGANIEVLRNRKDRSLRLAPLYDHGVSLLCRCQSINDIPSFDVLADRKVQSFIGTSSTLENLSLIPQYYIRSFLHEHSIADIDRTRLFEGLEDILAEQYIEVIWKMITGRWNQLDSF